MADLRREWLIAASALVMLVAVVLLFTPPAQQVAYDRRLSTLRTTPDGAGALFELLGELGVPAERRTLPLSTTRGATAIALLAPSVPLSPVERDTLVAWVRGGGTLLAALRPGDALLDRLGLASVPGGGAPDDFARPAPHELTAGIDSVGPVRHVLRDTLPSDAARPLADRRHLLWLDGEIVAMDARLGRGTVVLFSEPRLFENARIGESGVATIFARAAARAAATGATLQFDEFHHGHTGGTPGQALLAFLRDHPAGRTALQLAVVLLLALVPAAIRFGAPLPAAAPRRRSPLEHVAALGEVYRQSGAEELARRRLLMGFARRLGRERPAPGQEIDLLRRVEAGAPAAADATAAVRAAWERGAPARELAARIDDAVHRLNRKS